MAASESLKGIHVLQDRMRGVEGMLEGVGDMLQGFDERMKDIRQNGTNGAQITFHFVIFTIHSFLYGQMPSMRQVRGPMTPTRCL